MKNLLGGLLAVIFVGLGMLHVYWAFGGQSGRAAGVPAGGGTPLFQPSRLATLLIAVGLLAAAVVTAGAVGWLGEAVPTIFFRQLTLATSLVFLLRAIGDFKYIGFFRHASESAFAYWDVRLYSPLCLFIALASLVLAWSAL